ncbi:MAG: hypothetical protein R2753_17845 [Chitinophagales bacterium]
MCGINGFIAQNYNELDLAEMTNALQHRGPDAQGSYFDKILNIGLGHR